MAIHPIFKTVGFEPDAILVLSAAYEDALRVLQLTDRQNPVREVVARKIIEVAQTGELNPKRIRERALIELDIPPGRV
jgi:hypothetical protein